MENSYRRWQELQEEISYQEVKDDVSIQYKAFKGKAHIATIVVWSHKINKSCMLIWRGAHQTCRLCGSLNEAKDLVEQ
tara:strand:+ start:122 stop:355 length:234 start_codon:yes stop_codon:yes gene_type:complete